MKRKSFIMRAAALVAAVAAIACQAPAGEDSDLPTKPINEMNYSPEATSFEVWAPTAEAVVVRLYDGDVVAEEVTMERTAKGLWCAEVAGDHKGRYYAFQVTIAGNRLKETAGIFAKALDVNGNRGAVIDLRDTDPEGWAVDKRPSFERMRNARKYSYYRFYTEKFANYLGEHVTGKESLR
jgi:pullulanase